MSSKIIRMIICFILLFIGVVFISQAKDFLDLSKLVLSFAFGIWLTNKF